MPSSSSRAGSPDPLASAEAIGTLGDAVCWIVTLSFQQIQEDVLDVMDALAWAVAESTRTTISASTLFCLDALVCRSSVPATRRLLLDRAVTGVGAPLLDYLATALATRAFAATLDPTVLDHWMFDDMLFDDATTANPTAEDVVAAMLVHGIVRCKHHLGGDPTLEALCAKHALPLVVASSRLTADKFHFRDIINIVAAGGTTAGIAGDIVAVARSRLSPHLPRPRPRDIVAASKMLCAFDGDANAPTAAAFFRTYLNAVLEALSPAERSDRDAITEFVTPALARIESRPPLGEDIAALVARVRRALV